MLPTYTKSWLDQTNKRSLIIDGFSPKRFLISIFLASEKFDSNLELDAWSFLEFWNPLDMIGFKVGWEKQKHKKVTKKKDRGFLGAQGHTREGGGGEQEEDTLKNGLTLLGEGDSMLLPLKALNESSFNGPFQYVLL